MIEKYSTENFLTTQKIGQDLAEKILKKDSKKSFVFGLIGELGAGKTTFLQGFAKGLKIKEKILSPTFVIFKKYRIKNINQKQIKQYFYHFDCYRIDKPAEILNLNFKEIINNPQNIVAVEWADKIKKNMPVKTIWLKFKIKEKDERQIIFSKT